MSCSAINHLTVSAFGGQQHFFRLSKMYDRIFTPPCYASSQDMSKDSISFSHLAQSFGF